MTDIVEKPEEVIPDNKTDEAKEEEDKSESPESVNNTNDEPVDKTNEPADKTDEPVNGDLTELHEKIIRQIEYYFGDVNLLRDKFLQSQIAKDEEGWVPFEVLLTFKRLAALSKDVDVITEALQKSEEGLVEVNEDKTKIRRHPERPMPEYNEEKRKEMMSRTVYVKGLPADSDLNTLVEFFNPFEKVVNVTMRKYLDKPTKTYKFKGSVFITFATKAQAEQFMGKQGVRYKDTVLIREWQEKYFEEKKQEENRKDRHRKKMQKKKKDGKEDTFQLPKGTVIFFDEANGNTTRELIRSAVEALNATVAYIDYSKGEKNGHIRLQAENSANDLIEKVDDKKLKLSDSTELPIRVLSEEEETVFLAKVVEQMKSRRINHNRNKGGPRRKRRGGGEDRSAEPKAKVQKVE